jgi:hypothetical protein
MVQGYVVVPLVRMTHQGHSRAILKCGFTQDRGDKFTD